MDTVTSSSVAKAQELLTDIIERSELLVDLGYSSLIFNSKDLAEDVIEIFQTLDQDYVQFQETVLRLASKVEHPEQLWSLLHMVENARDIGESTLRLADVVLHGLPTHEILHSIVQMSDEALVRIGVAEQSKLAGKTLGEIRLQDQTGMRVIAIKRGEAWIHGPDRDQKIEAGDLLLAKGPIESESQLKKFALGG